MGVFLLLFALVVGDLALAVGADVRPVNRRTDATPDTEPHPDPGGDLFGGGPVHHSTQIKTHKPNAAASIISSTRPGSLCSCPSSGIQTSVIVTPWIASTIRFRSR
jgi:hypothetical protein